MCMSIPFSPWSPRPPSRGRWVIYLPLPARGRRARAFKRGVTAERCCGDLPARDRRHRFNTCRSAGPGSRPPQTSRHLRGDKPMNITSERRMLPTWRSVALCPPYREASHGQFPQDRIAVGGTGVQDRPRGQGERKHAPAHGLHVCNGANVDEQRAFDANETNVGQVRRQAFDGIPADVFRASAPDRHIVAVRLDVVDGFRVHWIESVFTLSDEKLECGPARAGGLLSRLWLVRSSRGITACIGWITGSRVRDDTMRTHALGPI